ncbi:MAG TPA: hypothetical protein VEO01_01165 [Pseudonocardiaceae bacterium]|nr:hypothetical protein [Pseudonocardiaceae bacterium]
MLPSARAVMCAVVAVAFVVGAVMAAPTCRAVFIAATTNPGNSWSAADCFRTATSPVYLSGFEHGTVSDQGSGVFNTLYHTAGTITADSATKRTGSYSLKIAKASGGDTEASAWTGNSAPTIVTARFYIRLPSTPTTVTGGLFDLYPTITKNATLGYNTATNKLRMGWALSGSSGTGWKDAASTVALNTWYRIDMRANFAASPNTIDWQIDGVNQTQSTIVQNADYLDSEGVDIGGDVTNDVYTAFYDDVMVTGSGADYPIGAGGVSAVVLDGMGTSSDPSNRIQNDDGTAWDANSYTRVRDIPMSAGTDYVKQIATDTSAYLEFTFADSSQTCIQAVEGIVAVTSTTAGAVSGSTKFYEGGSSRAALASDMSTGGVRSYDSGIITPATGSWTRTKFNGLTVRVGYATVNTSIPHWDALMVEYAWA